MALHQCPLSREPAVGVALRRGPWEGRQAPALSFTLPLPENASPWSCLRLEIKFPFCSDAIREKMKKNYMSNPSYNYEIVNRASLACGPMVKWAIAQVMTGP